MVLKCKKSYYILNNGGKNIPLYKKGLFYEIKNTDIIVDSSLSFFNVPDKIYIQYLDRVISCEKYFYDNKISLAMLREQQINSIFDA